MVRKSILIAVAAVSSTTYAGCGAGTPDATVKTSGSEYVALKGSKTLYEGASYLEAVQTAIDSLNSGERVSVLDGGDIISGVINLDSGKTFEGCATIKASGAVAVESVNSKDVKIPYLDISGSVAVGAHFSGVQGLTLGDIKISLANSSTTALHIEDDSRDIQIDRITTRNSARGLYFTSKVSNVDIGNVDLAGHKTSPLTVVNVYDFKVHDGKVAESGIVLVDSKDDFPRSKDIYLAFDHEKGYVVEEPCNGKVTEGLVIETRGGVTGGCLPYPTDE